MAESVTQTTNVVIPEVMAQMVNEKIEAQLKHIEYAKMDNTLVGAPGTEVKVPFWKYSGDAEDIEEGVEVEADNLESDTNTFTIKTATKSIGVSQEAVNAGLGDPKATAMRQVSKAIAGKMNADVVSAAYKASRVYTPAGGTLATIGYNGIVHAVNEYEDEEDGIDKVLFINPFQAKSLLTDPLFYDKSKFGGNVAVKGAIGMISGCWIKKSKMIPLINAEASTSGTSGAVKVTAQNQRTYHIYDAANHAVLVPAIDSYVKALSVPYYLNQFIKLREDSAETEYTEGELPALTIYKKKDADVDYEWLPRKRRHYFTASAYYGAALTNDDKVTLAKFAAS